MKLITYVFPGQGTQKIGMGKELFDYFPELVETANEVLGYSIQRLCLEAGYLDLNQTQYTQTATYVVNSLSYLYEVLQTGLKPNFLAGHSIGEYSALFAAGAFDFATGLKLVKMRAEFMGQCRGGAMAAVLGIDEEEIIQIKNKQGLDSIDIANLNSPYQIVISGPEGDIKRASQIYEAAPGVRIVIPLNTSGAFHSRYMKEAADSYREYIDKVTFHKLTIPVISNQTARLYDSNCIGDTLVNQIQNSIRWTDTIRYLLGFGEMEIKVLGEKKMLTGMIQKIIDESKPFIIGESERESILYHYNERKEEAVEDQKKITKVAESKKKERKKLGSALFRKRYNLDQAYVIGGMHYGISGSALIEEAADAGLLAFFGTRGLDNEAIDRTLSRLKERLGNGKLLGMNITHNMNEHQKDKELFDISRKFEVDVIELSGFIFITEELVKFRAKTVKRNAQGKRFSATKLIAKVTRPEIAEAFLNAPPEQIISKLIQKREITEDQASIVRDFPIADDICVLGDSAGFAGQIALSNLLPTVIKLKNDIQKKNQYENIIGVGAAGGIGNPESVASAFILGADFVVTGSVNQCTCEADTSEKVKTLLAKMNVQDTEYAPYDEMFEIGGKVQVAKKGVFFPARANKLYLIYQSHASVESIEDVVMENLERNYYHEKITTILKGNRSQNKKLELAYLFKYYLKNTLAETQRMDNEDIVNMQIYCSSAMGALNHWLKDTELNSWKDRHAGNIGLKLMEDANMVISRFLEVEI